jgi:hypothetical protein
MNDYQSKNRPSEFIIISILLSKKIYNRYWRRAFSDCAIGVLNKSVNEDSLRALAMLDEKYPVNIDSFDD